jgi:hypothetical protein
MENEEFVQIWVRPKAVYALLFTPKLEIRVDIELFPPSLWT